MVRSRNYSAATIVVISAFLSVFFLSSCGASQGSEQTASVSPSPAAAAMSPEQLADVSYVSGEVLFSDGSGTWNNMEIGQKLAMGTIVKTSADGECELQFGTLGVVRLQPATQIVLKTVALKPESKKADIELLAGVVANKVSKLSGSDRYQVKTPYAVAGVRGTEFVVRQTDAATTVAVKEGGVAIMPPSIDIASLESQASNDAAIQLINASLQSIQSNSGLVSSSEQVVIGAAESSALTSASEQVQTALTAALQSGSAQATIPAEIQTALDGYARQIKTRPVKKVPVEPELDKRLQEIGAVIIGGATAPAASPAPSPAPSPSAAAQTEVSAAKATLAIRAEPKDALISIDGAQLGTGAYTYSGAAGSTVNITVSREGYGEFTQTVKLDTRNPDIQASLKALPLYKTISTAGFKATGALIADAGGFLLKDAKQGFAMFDISGAQRWGAKAPSSFNTAAYGISDAGTLWYAGDKELAAWSLAKGEKKTSIALDAGVTGKRPLLLGDALYFSGPDGLDIFDASSLEKRKTVALPTVSDMTPAAYNGKILVADQSGAFHIVDPASGTLVTVATQASQPLVSAPVVSGNTAIFADRKGLVVAVSLTSNSVLWQEVLDPAKSVRVQDQPSVGKGFVFVYAGGTLYTLSISNGKSARPAASGVSAAPLLFADKLWYGTSDKKIVVADAASGKTLYSQQAGGTVSATPAQTKGFVGFALDSGEIVVLNQAGL